MSNVYFLGRARTRSTPTSAPTIPPPSTPSYASSRRPALAPPLPAPPPPGLAVPPFGGRVGSSDKGKCSVDCVVAVEVNGADAFIVVIAVVVVDAGADYCFYSIFIID